MHMCMYIYVYTHTHTHTYTYTYTYRHTINIARPPPSDRPRNGPARPKKRGAGPASPGSSFED